MMAPTEARSNGIDERESESGSKVKDDQEDQGEQGET